ncbi:uncharacterized protein BDZ83DRAFT_581622, partial [Colletotrichum acutatum]
INRLLTEANRLEHKEEAEKLLLHQRAEALRRAQAKINKSLSKLNRLQKAKRIVFKKGRAIPSPSKEVVSFKESVII